MEMTIKRVIGAVYPIPHRFIERILAGKDVFVKYLPHLSTRLKVGDKLMFYASGKIQAVVGEATIDGVEFLKPEDALAKYQNRPKNPSSERRAGRVRIFIIS